MTLPSGGAPPAETPATAAPAPGHSSRAVARSAGLIGAATMTSRILGLVREQVMAYLFGAGNAVDAFNVAFRIPNLVRDLFAEGAMSAAFVPTFTRYLTRDGREAAWRLGSHVLNALLVVTVVLVAAGIVFAEPLVWLLAGDYALVPGKFELTVTLTRLMLPFLTLVALAAACMGMLNSLDRYFVPALAPALFNVASITVTVIAVPTLMWLGQPTIHAMAYGVIAGGLAQLALQWPALGREGYRHRLVLDPAEPGLRQVLLLMGPGTLGLAATQVNVFVNTWLATGEGTGAVSWLGYAFRLMYLPLGIFGVSIATASLPGIARRAAAKDLAGMRDSVSSGLAMMLTLNVPATVGLIVLAHPIVALLFERGQFMAADTAATAGALMAYAVGLTGYSVVKIASPTFYALGQSRTPVLVSVLSVLTNAALNIWLVQVYGYRGLALGTSITALLNAGLLVVLLRGRLGGLGLAHLGSVLARVAVASAIMGVLAWALDRQLLTWVPGGGLAVQLVRVGLTIAGALATLALALHVLRVREFTDVVGAVAARVRRGRLR
jgi:putative peptidoglycan lipid II flippase